jgi:transposase
MNESWDVITIARADIEGFIDRSHKQALQQGDNDFGAKLGEAYLTLLDLLEKQTTTLKMVRCLFLFKTEKSRKVVPHREKKDNQAPIGDEKSTGDQADHLRDQDASENNQPLSAQPSAPKKKGHGRNGSDAYHGARTNEVKLEETVCPHCGEHLDERKPKVIIRVYGQAPLSATRFELQRKRCRICGKTTTAPLPPEAGEEKYDAPAKAIVAQLKYGSGMPFHRLEGLQEQAGVPLPASTAYGLATDLATQAAPVYAALTTQAAQGSVIFNDDTSILIQERLTALRREEKENGGRKPDRTGTFTTALVSEVGNYRIALYCSGKHHAGENLSALLAQRAADRRPPIQMCDALSRNIPHDATTILAHCLVHGRRYFVNLVESFPDKVRFVLDTLGTVFYHDQLARDQSLSDQERLCFHQKNSKPLMTTLHGWMEDQFSTREVEPNSNLGKAIQYFLTHWQELTLFLRVAGAPLSSNVVERVLKRVILNRKNAYFFKTTRGAQIGDLFMSLIETCSLNGIPSFPYLVALQHHAEAVKANPTLWFPWNYQEQLAIEPTIALQAS